MSAPFRLQRRVEFCETDAAGIAHFSSFFLFMEQAEHALLRNLGLSVHQQDSEGLLSWPRVHAACDYLSPVRFEQILDVAVSVERLGEKSATYAFDFSLAGRPVAKGKVTTVCCRVVPDQPPRAVPIPAWIAELLRRHSL